MNAAADLLDVLEPPAADPPALTRRHGATVLVASGGLPAATDAASRSRIPDHAEVRA